MKSFLNKRTVIVSFIAIGVIIACLFWTRSWPQQTEDRPVDAGPDELYRELIIGNWMDDYKGRRTMTVRPDGTATMVVEPDGLNALLGSRLTFEEEWVIENGRFKLKAVGGEPETSVRLILNTMGTESDQKILELSAERLLLLDSDGKTKYDWRRTNL